MTPEMTLETMIRQLMEDTWLRKGVASPFWPACWRFVQRRRELTSLSQSDVRRTMRELRNAEAMKRWASIHRG
jgi:hypothetical protein